MDERKLRSRNCLPCGNFAWTGMKSRYSVIQRIEINFKGILKDNLHLKYDIFIHSLFRKVFRIVKHVDWKIMSLQIRKFSLFCATRPIHSDLFLRGGDLWTLSIRLLFFAWLRLSTLNTKQQKIYTSVTHGEKIFTLFYQAYKLEFLVVVANNFALGWVSFNR